MYDVIIIGKGPAGISASLYTLRANLKTLIIAKGDSSLMKAQKIENYYGFEEPISGRELLESGVKQALRLGAEIVEDEVVSIEKEDLFKVTASNGVYTAKAVLLATGQVQKKLNIVNIDKFEGKGVSYCSTCDGFFYRKLKVGVLGNKDFAAHEALELENFTDKITIYTNGMELDMTPVFSEKISKFTVNKKLIAKVDGEEFLENIYFSDGTSEAVDGLFIANERATGSDFARKLGVITEDGFIVVDKDQKTNIEGLFAAGDCVGGFKQISVAVGEGAKAGRSIIDYVRNHKLHT